MNLNLIKTIGFGALEAAYYKQVALSDEGTIGIRVSKGAGGDTSLRGDIESEQEAIRVLRVNNFPAIVYAEEHGIVELSETPKYLIVIDGFDGSSGLAKNNKARGGTMLAIAENLNPRYEDFIFGGITDFSTSRIIYGLKNKGVLLLNKLSKDLKNMKISKLEKFPKKYFNLDIRVHIDDPKYWGEYAEGITSQLNSIAKITRENFTNKLEGKVKLSGLNSSGAMCMDLAVGEVDAVCGVSAKGVFEQPSEYPILREIGGTIVDYSGKDIGKNYWLKDREMHKNNPVPSLRVSSPELAKEIINYLILKIF
jgi:fructose-1,6-bisphosphatase/inositol monophosphatase family enzyme